MRRFLKTRTWVVFAMVTFAGAAAVPIVRISADPYGVALRRQIKPLPENPPATSPYSKAYNRDMIRLVNRIGRRSSWSQDDQDWLLELIEGGWSRDLEPPRFSDDPFGHETFSLYGMAMTLVSDRLGKSYPVPPEVENAFEQALLADLGSPFWAVRHAAVSDVSQASLMDRPQFFEVVEGMSRTDPNPRVQRLARRWVVIARGGRDPGAAGGCPTCPGGRRE